MAIDGKKIVIGIDGGGTKTHGILYEESGKILAEGFTPSSNPHSNPEPSVRASLHNLLESLLKDGAVSLENVDGICLGMAGCDRPADRGFIEGIMREKIDDLVKLVIVNDAVIAMMAVLSRLHGILVIAGTGSICFGFHEGKNEKRRCGGWGHLIADQGSGYLIGLSAIRAILDEYDGRIDKTSLTDVILSGLGLQSPTDLVGWTYTSGNGKTEIAALARYVHNEADKGDEIAAGILDNQAAQLFETVVPVYKHLFADNGKPVPLALWGGNLIHAKGYRERFIRHVKSSGLDLEPVKRDEQAVVGAAKYMLQQLD